MALLEIRGLAKQYGKRVVVDGVDLDIQDREIVGLLGPNGAGKTTTFRMAAGMIEPLRGTVYFNGTDVTNMPMYERARLGLGYLAQDSSVFRKLTVEENLYAIMELMRYRRGKPFRFKRKERRRRAEELLEQFGLTKLRRSLSVTLSGGERRRLEIARCLVSEPMLILLDEPFTGIDPKTVGDIQETVMQLRNDGIAVLITDHHVAETLRITDRSYLIAEGKMLTHGTPSDIVNDPRARKVYLGEKFVAAAIGEEIVAPPSNTFRPLLEAEQLIDWVNQLGNESHREAMECLRQRGQEAIPELLDALQRRDPQIRERAFHLLCEIVPIKLPFDPHADETMRRQQTTAVRREIRQRLAG